jgi:hypothetical protein
VRTRHLRRKTAAPRAPKKAKKPPFPGAWSLLVIDSEPIRKGAHVEYTKVLRETEKAQKEIERFQSEDLPLYSKWLNSTFGALLTDTRQIQTRVHELQTLIDMVEGEFLYGRHHSYASAYRKVIWRRDHPEEAQEEIKQAQAQEDQERDQARERIREIFGIEDELFDEILGDGFDDESGGGFGQNGFFNLASAQRREARADGRLKEVYRNLVRKLHPDSAGARSARQMEWWHQAQEAYQAGDVERLEALLSLAEMEEDSGKATTVSILKQLTAQFKEGLNALRRQLRAYRRDVAWNFSKLRDFEPIRQRTAEKLHREKQALMQMQIAGERLVESWKQMMEEPERKRGTRKRRSAPVEADPWF